MQFQCLNIIIKVMHLIENALLYLLMKDAPEETRKKAISQQLINENQFRNTQFGQKN